MTRLLLLLLLSMPALSATPASAATVDEVHMETARWMSPPLKVLPIALATPLAVAGVSIAYSSPIAWAEGDLLGWNLMRTVGVGVMGGGLGTGIALNAMSRAARLLSGGTFVENLHWLIVGPSLAGVGYAVTLVATSATVLTNTPLAVALSIGGGVAWGAGMVMLIVDAAKTAFENDARILATQWRPGRVQFAGWSLGPNDVGGLSGGVAFRF
ncbi:MAG: hypothetical protein GY898_13180 [Proteobacteria bacterium]|nr:hypothetical protein [Pseudomonadota bacterium]